MSFGALGFFGDATSDFLAESYGLDTVNSGGVTLPSIAYQPPPAETSPIGTSGSWWEDLLNAGVDITRANDSAKAAAALAQYKATTPVYNPALIAQNTATANAQAAALATTATSGIANASTFLINNWPIVAVAAVAIVLFKSGR